jgi:hypothetical protein
VTITVLHNVWLIQFVSSGRYAFLERGGDDVIVMIKYWTQVDGSFICLLHVLAYKSYHVLENNRFPSSLLFDLGHQVLSSPS